MVSRGVPAPCSAALGDEARGGFVVVAEGFRDDWGRRLEDELADRGGSAALEWEEVLPGRRAASMVASRTRRRERVRKSEETQVQIAVVEAWAWPTCYWTNSGSWPSSIRWVM